MIYRSLDLDIELFATKLLTKELLKYKPEYSEATGIIWHLCPARLREKDVLCGA
jgi:hypothetical protein